MRIWSVGRYTAAVVLLALSATYSHAQTPAEFYKGKTVELYIGYSVGGGYDLYARVLARHIGKHIPGNPTVVPKNMEGAGSLRLANWLYRVAPKDGTVFGTIGRGTGFDPVVRARRLTPVTCASDGRLRTHSPVRSIFCGVFELASSPSRHRQPSQNADDIGARL